MSIVSRKVHTWHVSYQNPQKMIVIPFAVLNVKQEYANRVANIRKQPTMVDFITPMMLAQIILSTCDKWEDLGVEFGRLIYTLNANGVTHTVVFLILSGGGSSIDFHFCESILFNVICYAKLSPY